MYASVRAYPDPSTAHALSARSEEIRAVIADVPGLRSYYVVAAESGTVTVTICDDQEGAEESNRIAADWLRDNMPELGSAGTPTVSAGPVVIAV